jgi:hypothetical protein
MDGILWQWIVSGDESILIHPRFFCWLYVVYHGRSILKGFDSLFVENTMIMSSPVVTGPQTWHPRQVTAGSSKPDEIPVSPSARQTFRGCLTS